MAVDATLAETHNPPDYDSLVPDPVVQKELGVTAMSIWRWDRDDELIKLGWPPAIRIRSRKFRSRIALENFKRSMAHRAIEQRAQFKAPTAQGDRASARLGPRPSRNPARRKAVSA
jgi:hypothetical protein